MKKIVIVGGGAAGFFAAIRAAELAKEQKKQIHITILEAGRRFLQKLRISGGGRCNVTHHDFNPKSFVARYPRGSKELLSVFARFSAKDLVDWFEKRGMPLKVEADGRMFPVTNDSETIIEGLIHEAKRYNIQMLDSQMVTHFSMKEGTFALHTLNQVFQADSILIATGSSPKGYSMARKLGHTIEELAPSLFSFIIRHPVFKDLSGTSFEQANVQLKIEGQKEFNESGPLLITHWGLSGPVILKLSAWAAREMKGSNYKAKLLLNVCNFKNKEMALKNLQDIKTAHPKGKVVNFRPQGVTNQFWKQLLSFSKIDLEEQFAQISKMQMQTLAQNLFALELNVSGKNRFKDEFVECGGIKRGEIDFKTMESKIQKGLFFAGEIIDIDGLTGGFNLQNAWSTGFIAGSNL